MAKAGAPDKLIVKNKRLDGRKLDQFRPISIDVGLIEQAVGSATFSFGKTQAIAGVYGPREVHPRHMKKPDISILRCKYAMAPFSTKERIRPGYSRRSIEISKIITEALSQVMFFEDYPKTAIDVFIEVLQADASTRCAGLNAASMALADAGVPMKDLVACCSVGKIDGKVVLDIDGKEDNFGEVDLPIATVNGSDNIVLLQMDGIISRKEFSEALKLGVESCRHLHEQMRKAIIDRYKTDIGEKDEE